MNIKKLAAYELVSQEDLKDLQSKGYLLRHKKTGAKVVLMENNDENKVFTIGFRTPTEDSTGLPHILEHSVLCGSKNFPVKDPFVELAKGSLNTFLNAMTYPDKTVYPVASCNEKDFQNLMHIYMDAVFYPKIYEYEEIFKQEGWSYKLESEEAELTYNGVVYNEMKGAFSSPEGVLDRMILNSLFPDTTYANESGGDPEVIPDLTYEQFLNFHKTYYHPSNSYIYLYGNMNMQEKLEWLDKEYLNEFEALKINSEITFQRPFEKCKEIEVKYSITNEESEENNTYLSYNKVIGTSLDKELYLAFQILDYALLSAPGAPLKKALIDAGIGKDIMGSYENGIYQPIFSVVSKNADKSQKEEFVKLIEDTLKDILKEGIDTKALEAGINYHEFRYREADFGNYPKGLIYGLQAFDSWLYDDEQPFMHVKAIPTFAFLKQQIGTAYFEELVQTYILENTHASIVIVSPERGRTARLEEALAERLKTYKETLSKEEIEGLVRSTEELLVYQEEPSTKEDMEKIPILSPKDITRNISVIKNEEHLLEEVKLFFHEFETNGIGYMTMMFDLKDIPEELLPYAGILQSVLGIIDTENYEYGELFNEINVHTGGIGTSLEVYADMQNVKEEKFAAFFEIKGKALYQKLSKTFEMMQEILMHSKLDDEKRLEEILAVTKSRMQMRFLSSGHTTAVMRAMSYTSQINKFKDMTGGIEFYELVKRIEENFETEKETLIQNLKELTQRIFRKENLIVSYTSEKEGFEGISESILSIKEVLGTEQIEVKPFELVCEKKNEGFKTSSKVQYVARGGNFIEKGMKYTGALHILRVILSYDYLWQNVRVKGGAYGCMSNFNRLGNGFFVSYRDPNLEKTNVVYEGIVEYLETFEADRREMDKYIIGTMSTLDQPMTPSTKGERSMSLYMANLTEDILIKERNEILDADAKDIKALAPYMKAILKSELFCVIGSEEKIKEAASMFQEVKSLF